MRCAQIAAWCLFSLYAFLLPVIPLRNAWIRITACISYPLKIVSKWVMLSFFRGIKVKFIFMPQNNSSNTPPFSSFVTLHYILTFTGLLISNFINIYQPQNFQYKLHSNTKLLHSHIPLSLFQTSSTCWKATYVQQTAS